LNKVQQAQTTRTNTTNQQRNLFWALDHSNGRVGKWKRQAYLFLAKAATFTAVYSRSGNKIALTCAQSCLVPYELKDEIVHVFDCGVV